MRRRSRRGEPPRGNAVGASIPVRPRDPLAIPVDIADREETRGSGDRNRETTRRRPGASGRAAPSPCNAVSRARLILTDNQTDTRHTKITPLDGATGGALVRQCHLSSSNSMSVGTPRSLLTARSDGQRDRRSHRLVAEGSASKTADPALLKISIQHTGRGSHSNPALNYREPEPASRGCYLFISAVLIRISLDHTYQVRIRTVSVFHTQPKKPRTYLH